MQMVLMELRRDIECEVMDTDETEHCKDRLGEEGKR